MNESDLFRQEAMEARGTSHLGSISIAKNISFRIIALVALTLGSMLIGFAVLGTFTRKTKLPGILVPAEGTLAIVASQAGTLSHLAVSEGDAVSSGAAIAIVDIDHVSSQGETAALLAMHVEQRRQSIENELALTKIQTEQRQHAYDERIKSMEAEQIQAEADERGLNRRIALAEVSVSKYEELAKSGYVPQVQAQQKNEELIDLQSRLIAAQRNLASLRRDTKALTAEKHDAQTSAREQMLQLDRNLVSVRQEQIENQAKQTLSLKAPRSGHIGSMLVHEGSAVQAGQTVATVIPSHLGSANSTRGVSLAAELYAPSRAAGFIGPGQSVWLRYAAYNYQKFGMARGVVISVSSAPVNPQDLPAGQQQALLTAVQTNEPLYKIAVALSAQDIHAYGEIRELKPGMALEADVEQDRRRIWEWIFDPIRSTLSSNSYHNQ